MSCIKLKVVCLNFWKLNYQRRHKSTSYSCPSCPPSGCCPFMMNMYVDTEPPESYTIPSCWFQPIWKICSSKWESSPSRGENKKTKNELPPPRSSYHHGTTSYTIHYQSSENKPATSPLAPTTRSRLFLNINTLKVSNFCFFMCFASPSWKRKNGVSRKHLHFFGFFG